MRGRADLPDGAGQEVGLQPRHHQALGEEGGQDAAQDLQEAAVLRGRRRVHGLNWVGEE